MEEELKNPPIAIFSGGKGITGSFIVQSVLAQFPDNKVPVITYPDMTSEKKIEQAVNEVAKKEGIIVQTMINQKMRAILREKCLQKGVFSIDLVGDIMAYLTGLLDTEPLNQPGLYRKLNLEYFDRQESIDFALDTDDGQNVENIIVADVVLIGVSRVGKTPISIYLAMHGWKVANVPIVFGIQPPQELFQVDPNRVFGLTINTNQLLSLRKRRIQDYESMQMTDYVNPRKIREELDFAESICKRGDFTVINTTNKPVETTASQIISQIGHSFARGEQKLGRKL